MKDFIRSLLAEEQRAFGDYFKDDDFARKINDEILPEIFDRIYEILSPTV